MVYERLGPNYGEVGDGAWITTGPCWGKPSSPFTYLVRLIHIWPERVLDTCRFCGRYLCRSRVDRRTPTPCSEPCSYTSCRVAHRFRTPQQVSGGTARSHFIRRMAEQSGRCCQPKCRCTEPRRTSYVLLSWPYIYSYITSPQPNFWNSSAALQLAKQKLFKREEPMLLKRVVYLFTTRPKCSSSVRHYAI